MARRLATIVLGAILCASGASLVPWRAQAGDLDAAAEAEAKEATRLYKQGLYEEAAKLYAKLSVDYPDMPIFERNMGACYYYLKRPEPALSNLRNYLLHKQNIAPDDKAVVERWIEEMERLRAQPDTPAKAPSVAEPAGPTAADPSFPAQPPAFPGATPGMPVPESVPAMVPPAAPSASAALDLSRQPAERPSSAKDAPSSARWWLWGTVGGLVVAGAVTAVVLSRRDGTSNIPATMFGNQEAFQ